MQDAIADAPEDDRRDPPIDRDPPVDHGDPPIDHGDPPIDRDPELEAAVDALVSDTVACAMDGPAPDPAHGPAPDPAPPPSPESLRRLHDQAVEAARLAVAAVDDAHAQELRAMGARLRDEQAQLYARVMGPCLGAAVQQASAAGHRVATVLRFEGSERWSEFCILYMLKGPVKADQRAEMRAMGVSPLLPRLRRELQAAGFGVHHAWQRATNENTLAVTW